uniref:Solute carrier family 25 (Mitochondrial phosphate transporter), member 3 n=1 Tax=Tetraselmis sp. GSL018 TaxID=582737 RepID=A0A061R485_9CHLO
MVFRLSEAMGLKLNDGPQLHQLPRGLVAASAVEGRPAPTGLDLYARFAFAGAACCAITHGALTPVDVVKTRMQLEPQVYNKGMLAGFRQVAQNEGASALLTGFGPTCAGYFLQGGFKFGGYEFFKKQWVDALGLEKAQEYRTGIYLSSSAAAEFFADVALCPLEATRIRLVSNPSYASGLAGCAARLMKEEGVIRGFYSGFGPILFKQVPYTMAKFVVFEQLSEAVYSSLGKPKDQVDHSTQVAVNLGSGVGAGVAAAVISQPADTLLSMINKSGAGGSGGTVSRLVNIARELGLRGLFLGTGARCVMVGTLTAGQFAIYGDIKRVLNATGGTDIAKVTN